MSAPHELADSPAPSEDPVDIVSPRPPEGLDSLARKITRRTTDLIVIGFIVIGGLTVAQRLLVWWKTDPAETLADPEIVFSRAALAPWGAGPQGVAIDLAGKPLTLLRRTFEGTHAEAAGFLRRECRETVAAGEVTLPELTPEETRLTETLRKHPPVEADPAGRWALHEIGAPLSMTLGVRRADAPGTVDRVVCWGLLLPLAERSWSILQIMPRPTRGAEQVVDPLPLPAGVQPGLAVRDELGGQVVTFSGVGPVDVWRRHFDQLATMRQWVAAVEWSIQPEAASAAWSTPGPADARVDLRLTRVDGGWTGLIHISPTRQKDHP
jgi:hypothetical protein